MKTNNKKLRDALIVKVWAEYKNLITMEDIAEIFQLTLPSIYRILKENVKSN